MLTSRNKQTYGKERQKMNEYTPEQQAQLFQATLIWFHIILAVLFSLLILYCINRFIHYTYQSKFVEKLNEHDKALIHDYENCYPKFKKRKEQK